MNKLLITATIASVLALFVLVSSMDYIDASAEYDHYVKMVCEGTWPDFHNKKPNCQ